MALDVPPPPADAAPDTSQVDQEAGGEEQTDPMAGDPNALSAGQGNDEISQKYQQLSPDQQKAADKYVDSMLNNDDQAGGQDPNAQMPMESRFSFKRIIDEVFGEIEPTRPLDQDIERKEKKLGEDAMTEYQNPFTPGA